MKKLILSLAMSTLLLGINFSYGMDKKEGSNATSDLKQKSKSHIVRRDKKKDVDAAERRKSLAAPLVPATKTDEKRRTFSLLLSKMTLIPKHKVAESGTEDTAQSASSSNTPHVSVPEGQPADNLSTLIAPSLLPKESVESKPSVVESKAAEVFVQKRMSVKVFVPTSKSDDQQTIFEPRDVVVSPVKVEVDAPAMNPAKMQIARRVTLLRTVYVTGKQNGDGRAELKRSGRDSMTEYSAKELLGSQGVGALHANPSPGQSPRAEDTVTPRADDTTTPRTDDAEAPRSGEDASSPNHDEAGDAASNDSANKTE